MTHVCVIGGAGGIGQSLSLLLKLNLPHGSTLTIFDMFGAPGVAADLSHIDTPVKIRTAASLAEAAKDVDLFVCVAGMPRKPGMTRDDLFNKNASIALDIVQTCGKVSPKAIFCIVTNPVNSTVPIAAQALKKLGVYDKNKLFGISTLDMLRATTFLNGKRDPIWVKDVPVVGGHSDVTIVPLFSQCAGPQLPQDVLEAVTKRTQQGGTEVVKAKAGKGSATLSMAAAGARIALNIVEALQGRATPTVYSYVDTDGTQKLPFLAIPVVLGKNGIDKRLPIGNMTDYEKKLLESAEKVIAKNIAVGEKFARSKL